MAARSVSQDDEPFLKAGTVVDDQYKVSKRLGKGGYGTNSVAPVFRLVCCSRDSRASDLALLSFVRCRSCFFDSCLPRAGEIYLVESLKTGEQLAMKCEKPSKQGSLDEEIRILRILRGSWRQHFS